MIYGQQLICNKTKEKSCNAPAAVKVEAFNIYKKILILFDFFITFFMYIAMHCKSNKLWAGEKKKKCSFVCVAVNNSGNSQHGD